MAATITSPRVVLRKLRQIIDEVGDAEERLGHVVRLVAATMAADVCSLYEMLPDGSVVLRATQGLRPDAAGIVKYGANEGLPGLVAHTQQALNVANAAEHPNFSYRAETGEEPRGGFLGVPLLLSGRTLGVLVVQNRATRTYEESEVETLQIVALVLAEILHSCESTRRDRIFISYRRQDSIHFAGRLFDLLSSRFDAERVYFDVDVIPFGVDFRTHIQGYLKNTGVLLALIGPRWISPEWNRKLHLFGSPRVDYVVSEIRSAIDEGVPIVPVLIDNARMPPERALPREIRVLSSLNAATISSGRNFKADVADLIGRIVEIAPDLGTASVTPP